MSTSPPRFPADTFESENLPYDHPQYLPGSAAFTNPVPGFQSDLSGGSPAQMPSTLAGAGDMSAVPVRDPFHLASVISLTLSVGAGLANVSSKFLDAPSNKRNMLILRNASATANIYVEFGKDATTQSVLRITPNTIILFDTVVPQNDLFALADDVNAVLSYGYSTTI